MTWSTSPVRRVEARGTLYLLGDVRYRRSLDQVSRERVALGDRYVTLEGISGHPTNPGKLWHHTRRRPAAPAGTWPQESSSPPSTCAPPSPASARCSPKSPPTCT